MYSKINWQADTLLTPARFRHMETQYEKAVDYWDSNENNTWVNLRTLTNFLLTAEVLGSAPAHGAGRLYHNSTDNKLYISTGTAWINLMEGL